MRLVAALLLCLASSTCRAADWSLQIAPLPGKPLPSVIHMGDTAPVFHVLMKNISGRPLLIWKERCSYGYFNLHYLITRSNGQSFELRRMGGSWTWNTMDGMNIAPGAIVTWDGKFGVGSAGSDWGAFPADWKDGEKVRLQAIYESSPDPVDLKMFEQGRDQRCAEIQSDSTLDAKTREQELLGAGDELKHYLQAWTGKVMSPPISVTIDPISSTGSH